MPLPRSPSITPFGPGQRHRTVVPDEQRLAHELQVAVEHHDVERGSLPAGRLPPPGRCRPSPITSASLEGGFDACRPREGRLRTSART